MYSRLVLACAVVGVAFLSSCARELNLPPEPHDVPRDTTPPAFTNVRVTPAFARSGTVVVLAFDATEKLPADARAPKLNPEVTFGQQAMTCAANGLSYRCTWTVAEDDVEGEHTLTIVAT